MAIDTNLNFEVELERLKNWTNIFEPVLQLRKSIKECNDGLQQQIKARDNLIPSIDLLTSQIEDLSARHQSMLSEWQLAEDQLTADILALDEQKAQTADSAGSFKSIAAETDFLRASNAVYSRRITSNDRLIESLLVLEDLKLHETKAEGLRSKASTLDEEITRSEVESAQLQKRIVDAKKLWRKEWKQNDVCNTRNNQENSQKLATLEAALARCRQTVRSQAKEITRLLDKNSKLNDKVISDRIDSKPADFGSE